MSRFVSFWARGTLGLALTFGVFAPAYAQVADPNLAVPVKPEPPINPQGKPTTATEIVEGQMQMPFIQSNSAHLLQDAMAKYSLISEQGGFPIVGAGSYQKGQRGEAVATLNRRLYAEGYLRVEGTQGQYADLVTSATIEGIRRFQRNHGLAVTGKVEKTTLVELNVSVEQRMSTIQANIARLAAYQDELTNRYIIVNVPAQQLEAVVNGRVFERHNVIVGRPARPSPVVMTSLKRVKFNPYWNAPLSIVQKDILPRLQAGQIDYLTQLKIRIFQGDSNGPEVDPRTLDFRTLDPTKYLFREEPGPHSSMATAKIEFNSPFGIYLHDTPDKNLFNFNNRFFSSGCIRIQNMPQLVNWVLHGQDGIGPPRIKELADTLEQVEVELVDPPELRVVYLTAWAAQGGTVAFRNDIYDLDGSGFVMGQPLPLGELSADGQRFLLKPLRRVQSVDALEAEGKGFFGANGQSKIAPPANIKVNEVTKPILQKGNTKVVAAATTVNKPKGLFDWNAYRAKQAAEFNAAAKSKAKFQKPTDKKSLVVDKTIEKQGVNKTSAKTLDCKIVANGKLPAGCPVAAKVVDLAKKI